MSNLPGDCKYTKSHEWAKTEDDGSVLVGITEHAQDALGELVYVELPDINISVESGESVAVVESVKAASDIYSPIAGEIIAVNTELEATPELVNEEPHTKGWLFRLRPNDLADLDQMLSAAEYQTQLDADD